MSVKILLASIPHTAISGAFTASYLCPPLVLALMPVVFWSGLSDSVDVVRIQPSTGSETVLSVLALPALAVWRQSHLHVFVETP